MPTTLENWFTGENIGIFGGIEYFTPINGLSLKADYGADRHIAEQQSLNFKSPAPWSIGLNYAPYSWVDAGLALQGTDKVMARLNFKSTPAAWLFKKTKEQEPLNMRAFRSTFFTPNAMQQEAHKNGSVVYNIEHDNTSVKTSLDLQRNASTPSQLSKAAISIANHAGQNIENIGIRPTKYNLKGPLVQLNRRDLEMAIAHKQGSAEEIWKNTQLSKSAEKTSPLALNHFKREQFKLILDNQFSLSEEDSGILHRNALIAEVAGPTFFGLLHSSTAFRLTLANNLERIDEIRPRSLLPVRSNVYDFAEHRFAVEHAYIGYTHSLNSSWHSAITAGYLEEMYGGIGGEILYRPFDSRLALGADAWIALKRDPNQDFNMGFNGDSLLTGHLNAWYSLPKSDLTIHAKAGRYLAEDTGATVSLSKGFLNGASLEGFLTLTNAQDFDLFGGTTHTHHGIRLSLPLGSVPYIPEGSETRFSFSPFGRDAGQALHKPFDLYKETNAFSYDHIARYWHEITPAKKNAP